MSLGKACLVWHTHICDDILNGLLTPLRPHLKGQRTDADWKKLNREDKATKTTGQHAVSSNARRRHHEENPSPETRERAETSSTLLAARS